MDPKERLVFVVRSEPEAGAIERAGYSASVRPELVEEFDLFALMIRERGGYAILAEEEFSASLWKFETVLEAAGIPYHHAAGYSSFKDIQDQQGMQEWADREAGKALERIDEAVTEARKRKLEILGVHDVLDVALEISAGQADRERIPTGLQTLDEALGGGLPAGGLVTLGATSSTGKTTFALQVADHIAASGRPVLFVTIEQSRYELVAKSVSRLMRLQAKKFGWYSVGAGEIQSAKAREAWDEGTKDAFSGACGKYGATIAPNLYVMETDEQPKAEQVAKAAKAIEEQRGVAPVVFIDYLQLLAPASDRMTEKQAVDRNVMDLRHLARDMATCVFVISSLNRGSYSTGVTLEAFKESGAIEYGADVLLGMQPRGLADKLEDASEAKQKKVARQVEREFKAKANREVVVTILKNRGGAVHPDGIPLDYSAVSNLFTCSAPAGKPGKVTRVK